MLPRVHKYDDFVRPLILLQEAGFSSAIIAGGAFRDLYHGIYPRDIDIFVWDPAYSGESTPFDDILKAQAGNKSNCRSDHVWRTGPDCDAIWANTFDLGNYDEVDQSFDDYDEQEGKITAIWNVYKSSIHFQVVFTKLPPLEHMEQNFNIGLCKCYCDGKKIRYTNDFVTDATNRTLTIVAQNMTQKEYEYTIDEHIPRLRHKYPYPVRYSPLNEEKFNKPKTPHG